MRNQQSSSTSTQRPCKELRKPLTTKAVYEDELCYAFADIHPQAPIHVLVALREHITSLDDIDKADGKLLGHPPWLPPKSPAKKALAKGYRLVVNTGEDGGQTVDQLHVHLLGGRSLTWPPG